MGFRPTGEFLGNCLGCGSAVVRGKEYRQLPGGVIHGSRACLYQAVVKSYTAAPQYMGHSCPGCGCVITPGRQLALLRNGKVAHFNTECVAVAARAKRVE